MAGRLRVLSFVVDTDLSRRLRDELSGAGTVIEAVEASPGETDEVDVAVITGAEWAERARRLRRTTPRPATVLISSAPESRAVVAACEGELIGGCVPPDWRPGELVGECRRAVKLNRLRREIEDQQRHSSEHIEFLEKLSSIGSAISEASSPSSVLGTTVQAVHQIVDLEVCAILGAPSHAMPILHLHCHRPMSATAIREVRDRCVDVFTTATGNALNEDNLDIQISGEPIVDTECADTPHNTNHVLIQHEARPTGVLLVRSTDSTRRPHEVLQYLANRVGEALGRVSVQLSDERRRLSHMLESMADGLIMTNLQTDDVLINPSARRLLGISDEQAVTRLYLKEKLGFYPFDLVAASSESQGPPARRRDHRQQGTELHRISRARRRGKAHRRRRRAARLHRISRPGPAPVRVRLRRLPRSSGRR